MGKSSAETLKLLEEARQSGISLWVEGSRLRFRAPSGAISADLKSRMSASRAELILLLQQEADQQVDDAAPAANQLGLWFLQQLAPDNSAYNVQFSIEIFSAVCIDSLNEAFQTVVDRHESLRSTYPAVDGEPVRKVAGRVPVAVDVHDVSDKSHESVRSFVIERYRRPFDLSQWPLARLELFDRGDSRCILLLTAHHLVVDGTGLFVLVEELLALYEALVAKQRLPAPIDAASFGEFVDWQQDTLSQSDDDQRYWGVELQPYPPPLDLPSEHARADVPALVGKSVWHRLDKELSNELQKMGRESGTTNFVVYLSLWFAVLYRLSAADDVVVGTPVSGRTSAKFAATVGDLFNLLPIRLRDVSSLSFSSLLQSVKSKVLEAMNRQDYPLPLMVRNASGAGIQGQPPFQTTFALQDFTRQTPLQAILLAEDGTQANYRGLDLGPYRFEQQEGQFELSLDVWPDDRGVRCCWRYDSSLYSEAQIEAWCDAFEHLAREVCRAPEQPLSHYELVADAQHTDRFAASSTGSGQQADNTTLTRLFSASAAEFPAQTAVSGNDNTLTYAELDERSTAVAQQLVRQGIAAGDFVGLCAGRNENLPVLLLGILKTGAAYVPLDPAFPEQRLCYMVEHSQASCIICDDAFTSIFAPAGSEIIATKSLLATGSNDDNIQLPAGDASDSAYVIYTSGSTGVPKGVEVSHGNVVNFLRSMIREPGIAAGDKLLAVTTLSFDISVLELFAPLVAGATVDIASKEDVADTLRLGERIRANTISIMQATPSLWRMLLDTGWEGKSDLRVLCGGEAFPPDLADRLLPRVAEVWNMYGPTETTVWSSCARLHADERIHIGTPVDQTQLYVLNSAMRHQPIGVPGNLWIGGAGVSKGYLHDDDLTAAAFIDSPFADGQRLYDTGDIARINSSGQLEHLGRRDSQVKIRGFRIELGEIEARISEYPGVSSSAANVWKRSAGDSRLVAYVIGDDNLDLTQLRAFVAEQLPDYMVPQHYETIDQIPLTANGKVDRRRLPEPGAVQTDRVERAEDWTDFERQIANIWRDVVGVAEIRRDDSFFEIGGHSLLAARSVSRINAELATACSIRDLLSHPVLQDFAHKLAQSRAAGGDNTVSEIEVSDDTGPIPATSAQARMWYLYELEGGSSVYNLPLQIELSGTVDLDALQQSLNHVVARHDSLRTCFYEHDSRIFQRVVDCQVDVETSRVADDDELADRVSAFTAGEFDLTSAPLFRAHIFETNDKSYFVIVTHHIIADGISTQLLFEELADAYEVTCNSGNELPARPALQFSDFARWQQSRLTSQEYDQQLRYWCEQLSGDLPLLDFPSDKPRRAQSYRGALVKSHISQGVYAAAADYCREQGCTLYMLLMSVYAITLSKYTAQTDLIIGTPVHGRSHPQLERLIGMFANTLALRFKLDGDPGVGAFIETVRNTCAAAFENEDLPFEKLVEVLNPERDMSRTPVFQTMFTMQKTDDDLTRVSGGIDWAPVAMDSKVARTDISAWAWDSGKELLLALEYATDLFDKAVVEGFLNSFEHVLATVVEGHATRVSEIGLWPRPEAESHIERCNNTEIDFDPGQTTLDLFDRAVASTPKAVAIRSQADALTYRELSDTSSRIAAYLAELSIGVGDKVAVCLERSERMVAVLLAIMRAGATYVPLDPEHPAERLEFVIRDAGARLVFVSQPNSGIDVSDEVRMVALDDEWNKMQALAGDIEFASPLPEAVAYVIYTSGSTGKPKGVQVPHRALSNFLQAMQRRPGFNSDDSLLAVTTLSFDISGLEIFLPLVSGGCTIVASHDDVLDGNRLTRLIDEHDVSVMQATPATWRLLLAAGWQGSSNLRCLCGGEALPPDLVDSLQPRVKELWNMYGPTETTIWSSCAKIASSSELSIGTPIANTRMYVLDEHRQINPVGVPGELYISGSGVALGYLNRDSLTDAQFVGDPYSDRYETMYATGDHVRLRADGNYHYVGRKDNQVKLRGYRIELGDIESHVADIDGVEQVVANIVELRPGDSRLVAYIVGANTPDETQMRVSLREVLPEYMIPQHFVLLSSIPLSPSGKVDRKSLPMPDAIVVRGQGRAPESKTELAVAEAFSEVLGTEVADLDADFFELGGHSLLGAGVIARINAALGVDLSLKTLFQHTRCGELAQAIDEDSASRLPAQFTPLQSISVGKAAPLAYAQERIWFLQKMQPDSAAYNLAGALRLEGDLDHSALCNALNLILQRHEALRSRVQSTDGVPNQVVRQHHDLVLDPQSVRNESELQEHLTAAIARPFDLEHDALIRLRLFELEPQQHVLLIVIHHIVSDAWSLGILARELELAYNDPAAVKAAVSAEPLVQYSQFAVWQRDFLASDPVAAQMEFWKRELTGAPPYLEVPLDRPRPREFSFRGDSHAFSLSGDLSRRLNEFSRSSGATLYMTLLAIFKVLLSRYTGEEDILVGSPVAGRRHAESESLIGLFVNTLVMRTQIDSRDDFHACLSRVRDVTLNALENQDVPFERLVEELNPPRDLSRNPVFQIMFTLQNMALPQLDMKGLAASPVVLNRGAAQVDLSLSMWESDDQIHAVFEYASDLYDRQSIEGISASFEELASELISQPHAAVAEAKLMPAGQMSKFLSAFNDTADEEAGSGNVVSLFERSVAAYAKDTAVSDESGALSYAELDDRSSRFAQQLRSCGYSKGDLIAVCMARGNDLLIALLGILKIRAAYLPLDPEFPPDRIRYMLSDSNARCIVVSRNIDRSIFGDCSAQLFPIDAKELPPLDAGFATESARPDDLVYVIYTSGSTGMPKGVAIENRAFSNFLVSMSSTPGLQSNDKLLAVTTLSFDISMLELFLPLSVGAEVVIASKQAVADPAQLLSLVDDAGITAMQATPSMWRTLFDHNWSGGSLRIALCGGEPLPDDLRTRLTAAIGEVWNMYGPTETTIWSTCTRIEPTGVIHIGRPIANTEIRIRDAQDRDLPPGVPGELLIGGAGLARGYLNREELTREKFTGDDGRLYRTGDLARWTASGLLIHLGRIDSQVKVRGYRIELGEIEARLAEHEAVAECAATVIESRPGDQRLLAFFVAEQSVNGNELREFLKSRIPAYMLPQHFVELERLPLTPNAKLDRKALPTPDFGPVQGTGRAPETKTEVAVVEAFSDVLGTKVTDLDADFFELGGHSLLGAGVIARINASLGIDLSVKILFQHSRCGELAQAIEDASSARLPPQFTSLRSISVGKSVPLAYAQERIWFLQKMQPDSAAYNIAAALQFDGNLNRDALRTALNRILRRHESLRSRIRSKRGVPFQVVQKHRELELDIRPVRDEDELQGLLSATVSEAFDIEQDDLIRLRLYEVNPDQHVLLIVIHHIVADAWSLGIFARELEQTYNDPAVSGTPNADSLAQYSQFAVWQREFLESDSVAAQIDFWKRELAGRPPYLEVPLDRPRPGEFSFRGASHAFSLPTALSDQLNEFSRANGVTLYMTLLSIFKVLLARYTGEEDIIVGSPIAGRRHAESEALIGLFVNTLVMRTQVATSDDFRTCLGRVRDVTLNALEHQDLPFERLVEELNPPRDLSRNPVFQIMFTLQNMDLPRLDLNEIDVSALPLNRDAAQVDLSLAMWETDDQIHAVFEYASDLYDATSIAALAESFEQLASDLTSRPLSAVGEARLMPDEKLSRFMASFNDSAVEVAQEQNIVSLFERSARAHASETAVSDESGSLTYGELDKLANSFAQQLVSQGCTQGDLVAVCMERGNELLIALLAILKLRAAYLPLDPDFPAERIQYMLSDAGVGCIVVSPETDTELFGDCSADLLPLDAGQLTPVDAGPGRAEAEVRADDVVYVIYTSGSTGRPKGVVIENRAFTNFLLAMSSTPGLQPDDKLLAVTTLSFDISMLELFLPLIVGAEVVIASKKTVSDSRELLRVLRDSAITAMQATPSMWRTIFDRDWSGDGVRLALTGGEPLPDDLRTRLTEVVGEVWNMYGPTETTIWSTCTQVEPTGVIDIGRPIANTEIRIRDADNRDLPPGVPGELLIGGDGLAQGYLNRDELTRERFIGNGKRLYRTGDLGRWTASGRLLHLGRIDNQVKVRGYRIELGEIEARLAEHPAVSECAITVVENRPGDQRLIAFFVAEQAASATATELRAFLRSRIPSYMLPQHFLELDQLPLTPNAKLDRKALPALVGQVDSTKQAVEPETEAEIILAGIWREILTLDKVSSHDNFFDAGGHSLLAVQLIATLEEEFQITVSLQALTSDTLAQIAAAHEESLVRNSGRGGVAAKIYGLVRKLPFLSTASE